jgi:hypothetical protein
VPDAPFTRHHEKKKGKKKESLLDWLFLYTFFPLAYIYKRVFVFFYGWPTQEGGNRFSSSFINQKFFRDRKGG